MKNLFTLFLITIVSLSFGQQTLTFRGQPKQLKMLPTSQWPTFYDLGNSMYSRGSAACDTQDVLDYSTYNELIANQLQITYNGSWNSQAPQPYGSGLTSSFITVSSYQNQDVSYAMAAFDSLAFANFAGGNIYSKQLKGSIVTLDTLGMFIGVSADDTSTVGGLVGDSLVFSIYPITAGTISATAVKTITFAGHDSLAPFVTGTDPLELRYVQFGVGQTFTAGQGFAVKVNFYSGDTTSHCNLSWSYADSCGQISYEGQTFASPAFPSPFIASAQNSTGLVGNTYYGEIDSTGPTAAVVTNVSNGTYGYNIPGVAPDCLHLYIENWEIIALVSVQSQMGISITDSVYTIACTGSTAHPIVTVKTGDFAGATYAWSSNVFGSTSGANATFYNPGTYSVTATNSQGCTATAQEFAQYAGGLNVTPSFTFPAEICENAGALFTNTSSSINGYTPLWHFSEGPDSITAAANPTHTFTSLGVYTVTLVIDSAGCAFGTSQTVDVLDCTGIQNVAFNNNVTIIPNPSNGNVNISISDADKNVTLTVYNVIGQVVKTYATTESPSVFSKQLDLTNMSNGTYLLKIQSGTQTATKKLVITK